MSAGDRHRHIVLGERDYDRALRDPRFQAILSRGFRVSYDYDVPYLGGYSRDGTTIYIDRDTPAEIKRGKRIYHLRPHGLVGGICVHEHWEKTAMTAWGWSYAPAHELATHVENLFARDVLKMDPDEYQAAWRPVIRAAEKKLRMSGIALPGDLDRAPYM